MNGIMMRATMKATTRYPFTFLLIQVTKGFHDWISPNGIRDLLQATTSADVARIGFLRHGNTLPSDNDFERPLSETGRNQAMEAGLSFGKQLQPIHPIMLVSPAPRTMETAERFSKYADPTVTILPSQTLYEGTMQPGGSDVFRKIGYAPLCEYLNNNNMKERDLMNKLLGAYARDTATALVNHLQEHATFKQDDSSASSIVWIVGHAVYLPSVVLGIAHAAGFDQGSIDVALSTSTKEAEAYLVDLPTRTVQYMQRPSSKIPLLPQQQY